jgi:hypothetical protein
VPHARGTAPFYDVGMKFMHVVLPAALCAAIASIGAPALAADYQLDGQLPMYPHGKLDPKEASLTPAAIAHGVPLVLLTSDSVRDVDAWYGSHVAKACTRHEASGGVKFACPGGSIMIYPHAGQTQIAFVPPFPTF